MRLRIVLLNATHRLCVYRMVAVACGSCRSTLVLCNILYLLCFALRTQNFDIQLAARHVSKYWNWYKFRESMEFICHVVLNVYRSHYLTCSRKSLGHAGFALVPSFSKFIAPLWTSSQQAQSALLPTCFHFIASLWTFSPKVLDSSDNTATSMLRLWHSYRCFRFLACKNEGTM